MYKHKTISLKIANGETYAEGDLRLPAGSCIGVVTEDIGTEPATPVNLSIKDGGNEVIETLNYKFLKKTSGGRWVDSVMPVQFECDRSVNVRVNTSVAVGADFTVDVLFIIKQQNY